MSKKYVSVLKDSAATPGYRIIAPEDYVYTENGTKKVKKIDSKADKKVPATAGNLATLDSTGNLADSGKQTTDFMNALTTAYEASGSATKTVTKVTQAKTGAVTVTYSDIQSGTTSQKGLVQLENSTSSTSTTTAATPNSVKSAYDLANGKYSKPSGGIPSSDMDSTVQASLGKADTAIQGVKLNGSTLTPSSAKVVDLGNLKTKQTAVSDPSASGTTITAIATISQDTNGVITATKKTIQSASQSQDGVMSAADKKKLDGIATGAEVNQNAFSNVKVGDVTVAADTKTDTLTLAAGSNVTITPDATNDKITIAAKDTTYTADAGIRLDGTVFKHTNSVSGGTVGPTTDTAGATLSVPYVTYDSQGHVTASGTRTHNVGTASTSGAGIVQLQDSIDATATKAATPNAVKKAIEALDVSSVGGSGKYISAISENDGKISATATTMDATPTASSEKAVTSGGIKTALDGKQNTLPTTGTASDTYAINVSGKAYQLRSIEVKSPQSDKCWAKIAETTNNTTTDYHIAFSVHNDGYAVKSAYIGILSASIQQTNQGTAGRFAVYFYRADAVEFDAIKAVLVNTGTVLELWVCNKRASQYIYFTPLHSLRLSPVYGQDRVYTQDEFDAYISGKSYYPSVEKGINRSGTDAVGSSSIPVWVDANGTLTQCTDDFVHDGDVTSTYSATGTAPVNGTAVASAISTKSDKNNTVSICDGYAQGNVGKWYKIADTVVNGQNCDVTASFSIATSHYANDGYYGKLMFSFRHDTSGRPPKRFVEIESSRGNTGKVQVYVVTRGAVTGDVIYEIWVSNILDVKAYLFIRLLQSAIKVNPAKTLWNFYQNATASDTAPQDDSSTNTYRYLASELNWVKSVKIGSGSELKDASGNVSIPVDSTPTASSNNLMTSGAIKTALDGKSPTSHTHSVKINGAEKTIVATGGTAVDLGTYTEFAYVSNASLIDSGASAASCKTYFNSVTQGRTRVVYTDFGPENTLVFARSTSSSGQFGSIIKYGYPSKYIYLLRLKQGAWLSDDWEKISAGYSDVAGHLNLQQTNEINFTNVPTEGNKDRIWFNYRNGDTGAGDGGNLIKDYYFGNRNGGTTGVTVWAESFNGTAYYSNYTKVTTANTTKTYLAGATATGYTSGAQSSLLADTGVYLTTTSGELNATQYKVAEHCTMSYNSTKSSLDFSFS